MADGDMEARIASIEQQLEVFKKEFAVAQGEAMFAGMVASGTLAMLKAHQLISPSFIRISLDLMLLMVEKNRALPLAPQLPSVDFCRSRLEFLLEKNKDFMSP